jgi:hypothetical protein
MEIAEAGAEKSLGRVVGRDIPLHQYPAKDLVDPQGSLQRFHLAGFRL